MKKNINPLTNEKKKTPEYSEISFNNDSQIELKDNFPIVGIGASAGGLAAFEAFFSGMPTDTDPDMAFVLIQHLAPDHKSILTELIQRYTRMQVFEVEDGMKVMPNCAYIIPPGCDMAFINGVLQLLEPVSPRGQRLPIDYFFRSLAQDQHERAICIVLSGTGSDGTAGVRAIKGEGGMAMVQKPESTEYDGMPRSAVATGLIDYELPPAEMPAQLIAYVTHAFGKLHKEFTAPYVKNENAVKKIFVLLRSQTGHDFSQYKVSTIHRRIERRMAVHQIDNMNDYVKFIQQTPYEVESLFRDLLIGVTSFFRDPEAFQMLQDLVIPKLFIGKSSGSIIRVWSPGCSSGEEAYSIAILLQERMELLKQSYTIQVFATDIDSHAIATARAGIYPTNIAADITPERLDRYFSIEPNGGGLRIHKGIRDMMIFSEQDVIIDPPFSKLDLISCRNLLIYMGSELQKRIIPVFHYALNPSGFLFQGTSETVGEFSDLFSIVDRKSKLYQRKDDFCGVHHLSFGRFVPPATDKGVINPPNLKKTILRNKLPLRELTEQALIQQITQSAALVNSSGDILYLHGRTGMYLEPVQGEVGISNIIKMAREGLRHELLTSLHKAVSSKETVKSYGLRVKTNSHFTAVNLIVHPVVNDNVLSSGQDKEDVNKNPMYLVILSEDSEANHANHEKHNSYDMDTENSVNGQIEALKKELLAKEEYIQTTNEELETSNEELKSANEEMQSMNEELQSSNEELQTSKEEIQSVNEELTTVNIELQTKLIDLSRANNDMNNLLAGTEIATIFVDCKLSILRFTPTANRIINLIISDIGRPIGHIVSNLIGYDCLVNDITDVLNTLVPKEIEVQTKDSKFYTLRISPYRTLDNVIEGAVITFFDISRIKQAEDVLKMANDVLRFAAVVRDCSDAITVQDMEGNIIVWNPGAVKRYGWSEGEALTMKIRDVIPENLHSDYLSKIIELCHNHILEQYHTQRITKDGAIVDVSLISMELLDENGKMYAISTTERVK